MGRGGRWAEGALPAITSRTPGTTSIALPSPSAPGRLAQARKEVSGMAERPARMGWRRTALLALGGGIGAFLGTLITAWLIHLARR